MRVHSFELIRRLFGCPEPVLRGQAGARRSGSIGSIILGGCAKRTISKDGCITWSERRVIWKYKIPGGSIQVGNGMQILRRERLPFGVGCHPIVTVGCLGHARHTRWFGRNVKRANHVVLQSCCVCCQDEPQWNAKLRWTRWAVHCIALYQRVIPPLS